MITTPRQITLSPLVRFQRVLSPRFVGISHSPRSRPRLPRFRISSGLLSFIFTVTCAANPVTVTAPAEQCVFRSELVSALAVRFPLVVEPPLVACVLSVIGGCSEKKVAGIDAKSIVAAMTNNHPARYRPVVDFPRKSVPVKAHVNMRLHSDADLRIATPPPVGSPIDGPASRADNGVHGAVFPKALPEPHYQSIRQMIHTPNITRSRGRS